MCLTDMGTNSRDMSWARAKVSTQRESWGTKIECGGVTEDVSTRKWIKKAGPGHLELNTEWQMDRDGRRE